MTVPPVAAINEPPVAHEVESFTANQPCVAST